MKNLYFLFLFMFCFVVASFAQCTTSNATSCECLNPSENDCDLLPDITIEWNYAENSNTESAPGTHGPDGRLAISGHTPNIGVGPLNLRGLDINGDRWMVCTDPVTGVLDTFTVNDPNWNIQTYCPDGSEPKHIAFQRIYHKNSDGSMSYWERMANTFVYHPTHGHMHFDDWTILTLRIPDPNDPNPLNWPIIGDGAKLGFCVMDLSNCISNDCSDDATEYGQGNILNAPSDFPNYGLGGGSYGCSPVSQGISSGYSDIYGQHLDGMWLDIPVGTCNGDYAVVLEVGKGEMLESNSNNNYTWFPITLTEQSPSPSAGITASGPTILCPGESVTLNANTSASNPSYLWSDGSTGSSITVSQTGTYDVQITDGSFGSCSTSVSNFIEVTLASDTVDLALAAQVNAPVFDVDAVGGSYLLCNNSSVVLEVVNSNASGANYLWSNGDVGSSTTVSSVGDYSVFVTDNSFACHTTVSDIVSIVSPLAAPSISASQDTVCVGDPVVLQSVSGFETNWYDDASGTTLLSSGPSYTSAPLSATTTFYAASTFVGGSVGESVHSGSSDYSGGSTNAWIRFNVEAPITINSVDVFTDQGGDRTIVLWDENGVVLDSQTFNIQPTNNGQDPTTVSLNYTVPAGNNFILGTDTANNNVVFGNNNPELKRQGDQYYGYCYYPYTIDNVVELTGSPYGTDWYYYFYNWDVTPLPCESPLVSQEVVVVSCASVDEFSLDVKVYPNPTSDLLSVVLSEAAETRVFLYNVLGEAVLSSVLTQNSTLSLSGLPVGVYSLSVMNKNGTYKEKIVLQ